MESHKTLVPKDKINQLWLTAWVSARMCVRFTLPLNSSWDSKSRPNTSLPPADVEEEEACTGEQWHKKVESVYTYMYLGTICVLLVSYNLITEEQWYEYSLLLILPLHSDSEHTLCTSNGHFSQQHYTKMLSICQSLKHGCLCRQLQDSKTSLQLQYLDLRRRSLIIGVQPSTLQKLLLFFFNHIFNLLNACSAGQTFFGLYKCRVIFVCSYVAVRSVLWSYGVLLRSICLSSNKNGLLWLSSHPAY